MYSDLLGNHTPQYLDILEITPNRIDGLSYDSINSVIPLLAAASTNLIVFFDLSNNDICAEGRLYTTGSVK